MTIIIRAPRVIVGDSNIPKIPKDFIDLMKILNKKYNLGFNPNKLKAEIRQAQQMARVQLDEYNYWETRLTDTIDGRDDFDQILDEFQKEAAKLVV